MWLPFLAKQILSEQQRKGKPRMNFVRPLEKLEVFKITGLCEMSAPFSQFLDTVTKTSAE